MLLLGFGTYLLYYACNATVYTCRYCGGTEIGGGFLAGCMWRPQAASAFATPSLGSQLVLLTDHGQVRLPCDTSRSIVG